MRARALAVALFAACSSSPTGYAFDVDARFKPASRDAFLHAQDAWNAITNADHQLSIDGGDWRVAAEWPSPECGRHPGCTHSRARVVQIYSDGDVLTIARHELGHVLGLQHTCVSADETVSPAAPGAPPCVFGRPAGVMDPDNGSPTFTDSDLAECRRVSACQ